MRERFRLIENDRKVRRGILFAHELQAIDERVRTRAVEYFTARLARRPQEQPLSPSEIEALESGDYGNVGTALLRERRTMAERLRRIPELRAPVGPTEVIDPQTGEAIRVSRALSGIMRLDGLTSDERMLVGVVLRPARGDVQVIALNDAAVRQLGGYGTREVAPDRLTSATEDDLSP